MKKTIVVKPNPKMAKRQPPIAGATNKTPPRGGLMGFVTGNMAASGKKPKYPK